MFGPELKPNKINDDEDMHNGYLCFKSLTVMMQCIMTNHVHAIIAFRNTGKTSTSIIGNGKRFIAYDIVKRLQQQQENMLRSKLQGMVNNNQKSDNKQHEIFEPSFDWKA
jgi:hypothetical protein